MGRITKIAGPLVVAEQMKGTLLGELVLIGEDKLPGEVISIAEDRAYLQVYEDTHGLTAEEPVKNTGRIFSVELGPGLLGNYFDGLERPLGGREEEFIEKGVRISYLDREQEWDFKPKAKVGETLSEGDVLGSVNEKGFTHLIFVPPGMGGTLTSLSEGKFKIDEPIGKISTRDGVKDLTLKTDWQIRGRRQGKKTLSPSKMLVTGQRIIDTFFPALLGSSIAVPGGFGVGKTTLIHLLIKYANPDIFIFVGCGERGNEIIQIVKELQELKDRKGKPLLNRTVFITNTSNMPVAARTSSILTGACIGEYYRDMGYNVVLLVDSLTRWAEAQREVSNRLGELPGEEGYPPYLSRKIANFFERAGVVEVKKRKASLTIISSVSPIGGDLSEPVTQASLKGVETAWILDPDLAYKRKYPAINWDLSFSKVEEVAKREFDASVNRDFGLKKGRVLKLMKRWKELEKVSELIGMEAMSEEDQFVLLFMRLFDELFIVQNSKREYERFTSLKKQYLLMSSLLDLYDKGIEVLHKETYTPENMLSKENVNYLLEMKKQRGDELIRTYNIFIKKIEAIQ